MSMNTCFKCGDIYDTDYQMEEIDGEMVCDNCYEDQQETQDVIKLERYRSRLEASSDEELKETFIAIMECSPDFYFVRNPIYNMREMCIEVLVDVYMCELMEETTK